MPKTTFDFKGLSCPMPILKLAGAAKKAAPGDSFEVLSDDAGFEPDVRAWCKETGNILDSFTRAGNVMTAIITKK